MTTYVVVLAIWAQRSLGTSMGLAGTLPRIFGACALALLAFWRAPTIPVLCSIPVLDSLLRGALMGTLALGLYAGLLWLFRVSEFMELVQMIKRRLGRKG